MVKVRWLWSARYVFRDGGSVSFAVVAETAGDVADMLSEQVDPYRGRDITEVTITRAKGDFCKTCET